MSHSIPSSDELAEAEEILGQLERDGILAFIFDGSKLVLDGDWSEVPEATLERAKQCVPSLIQLLRATFAQRFEEAEPDTSPAEGARIMMGVNVCVSMNLSDQELEARVRRAMSVTGQGRQPAVVAYPAASLDDRRAALERWLPHLPELPI